jgi:hypothetical protein
MWGEKNMGFVGCRYDWYLHIGRQVLYIPLSNIIILFIQVYCPYATVSVMKTNPPSFLTDTNIHSDTQAEPRKLSSLALYIDLWQEGKPNRYRICMLLSIFLNYDP